jgi:PAS domain S-box-containing protein
LLRPEVLDSLFAGVVVYGVDGTVLEANRTAIETLGLNRADVVGKPAWEVSWWSRTAESRSRVREALRRAAAGETVREDFLICTGENRFSVVDTMFQPLRASDGRIECVISSGVDVSARKQAEAALMTSEARLRGILDSSPDCVKTVDAECRLLDMNAIGLAVIEADSLEEVRGRSVLDLIDPPFRTMYQEGVAAVFSGTPTQQQYEIIGLKGTRRWLEQRAVPFYESDDPRRVRAMLAITRDVTERVRAERGLRTTANQLVDAQRIAKIGSWELDLTSNTLAWSDEIYRIFEIDPAAFGASYKAFLNAVHPDDRAAVDTAYKDSLASRTPYEIDHRLLMADGRVTWVRERCETDFDAEGRPLISRGTAQDITERVCAEHALRTTAKRLEDAQRIAKLGSWELDLTSNALGWSDEMYSIFEIDPALCDPTYEVVLDAIHPGDRAAVDKTFRDSLPNKSAYEIVHRLLMPDGRVKWVRARCETQFDKEGRPIISRGTAQDFTERKTTEDALRQSEATLATFLKVSPEAIIVTDEKARITVFSTGAEAIFGYAAHEVIGREVECLMPEQVRDLHGKHVQGFRESRATAQIMSERSEIAGRRKNGEEFPAEASLSKLKTPLGMYFAAVLRDISSQRAIHKDLVAARIAAESANEAKSRFIANMSHELRTPLNVIIGFSELMMGQCFGALGDPRYREYAADIRKSGEHLLSLINEILDISRIEAGSIELNEEAPLEVEELMDHCTRWVAARAADTGVALRTEIAPETPALRGDPRLLAQILLNLISNALKFTPAGGLVTVRASVAANGGVEIAVADTGIGMSPQQLERVGEPFLQFDDDKGRKGEGTGLGVSIAKRLTELHGGELTIESAVGRGTTMTLRLPKARSVARTAPQVAARAS